MGIEDGKAVSFQTTVTIMYIKGENAVYHACPTCNKKVLDEGTGQYSCQKCNKSMSEFKYRMITSMSAADFSGSQWFTCFQVRGKPHAVAVPAGGSPVASVGIGGTHAGAFGRGAGPLGGGAGPSIPGRPERRPLRLLDLQMPRQSRDLQRPIAHACLREQRHTRELLGGEHTLGATRCLLLHALCWLSWPALACSRLLSPALTCWPCPGVAPQIEEIKRFG